MPAYDDDLGWYDRDEAYGQHVRVEAFYPEGLSAGSSPALGHDFLDAA